MATLLSFFLMFILVLLAHPRTSAGFICESTSCEIGGLPIQFPFWLRQANQSQLCGYPGGFELSCSNSTNGQPLITLPEAGDFVVKLFSLENQKIWINDPEECLPSRFMHNHGLNLEVSPFRLSDYYTIVDYSFLNCPSNLTSSLLVQPISCLNLSSNNKNNNNNNHHLNYSVVAVLSDPPFSTPWTSSCDLISTASIPVSDMVSLFWVDYYSDIQLEWDNPNCGSCEARGGRCGFLGDPPFNVACYDLPNQSQGLSRKAKYGISMGLGIPGLLGIIGLACFFCGKRNRGDQLRQTSTELSTLIMARPSVVVMGLDGAAIERYPKTQLGESGRLPKPNDNICSICLCEYQPKEMLRTIPECNHYFHANCIDGWLKMNATCPLCRNLPEGSSSFSRSLLLSPAS
ncbi:putative RING-H2 finger protein ATL21A [Gastrolobium bilobum]|uniref:putative RING-H2 finger protein ATL21A n=1 Tax=Gastrolobium bilobum TaxID=150636 RepID=UPI002AAFE2AD|nr:putative RING-H2 finger protein ATL21A [Gastrolobium bilobum]